MVVVTAKVCAQAVNAIHSPELWVVEMDTRAGAGDHATPDD